MLFSERKGFSSVRKTIQKDGMDEALRTGLWNTLDLCIWMRIRYDYRPHIHTSEFSNLYTLFLNYWQNLFKLPLDGLPEASAKVLQKLRNYFFECKWYESYDFIEFTAQNCPEELKDGFVDFCSHTLEREMSAYRFIGDQIVGITDEVETEAIESAINSTAKYPGAREHLKTAMDFLNDREKPDSKKPDCRNSVKESISAVEALCKSVSGDPKAKFSTALNKLGETYKLHPAFKEGFQNCMDMQAMPMV